MNKYWSDEEYKALEQLWLYGEMSMAQIGKALGRSRNAIASRIRDRHLKGLGARLPGQVFDGDRKRIGRLPRSS